MHIYYTILTSITHNKNRNPLLNLPINFISAKSEPQILSIKGECTFLLLSFRGVGFCNSSPNSLLQIYLIPLTEDFSSKHL